MSDLLETISIQNIFSPMSTYQNQDSLSFGGLFRFCFYNALCSIQLLLFIPGIPQVKIVHHHQAVNSKILIALILSSTLLSIVLLSLLCFWIYRLKNLRNSSDKSKQNFGNLNHSCNPLFLVSVEKSVSLIICVNVPFEDADRGLSLSPIIEHFNSLRIGGKKNSVCVIDYQLLEAATNNFEESNVLGEGGHGRVYKACFGEKYIAAVKRIDGQGQDAEKNFQVIIFVSHYSFGFWIWVIFIFLLALRLQNELNWLTRIRHQNIVSLIGYCISGETKLLVYEMMQIGSLENQLYGKGFIFLPTFCK